MRKLEFSQRKCFFLTRNELIGKIRMTNNIRPNNSESLRREIGRGGQFPHRVGSIDRNLFSASRSNGSTPGLVSGISESKSMAGNSAISGLLSPAPYRDSALMLPRAVVYRQV